jgi:hypothetical protein
LSMNQIGKRKQERGRTENYGQCLHYGQSTPCWPGGK